MQGNPGDMGAPAGGQPPLEALPVPLPPAPESSSQPPASTDSSPATLPKLTRPRTDNTPDGAAIKRKDTHIATMVYTTTAGIRAKAPIAKPVSTNSSCQEPHSSSVAKMSDSAAAAYQADNYDGANTRSHAPKTLGAREEMAKAAEICSAPRKKAEGMVGANCLSDTKTTEANGGRDFAAPTANEHTTFVFKQ